jgi:alpha-galactosidase
MCSLTDDTQTAEVSPDYATLDAEFFASSGVDAIKHDNCVDVANTTAAVTANYERYARLGAALNATGRPMLYDVVLQVAHEREVPAYDYGYLWSPEIYGKEKVQAMANMWWSLPVNKYNCWSCCVGNGERILDDSKCTSPTGNACRRGLLPMIDTQDMGTVGFSQEGHWDWAGKDKGWNHIDQLAVCVNQSWYGPGFTPTEQASQLALWAVLASPLIVSFDVRSMTPACKALVVNPRAIAVHQDSAGIPGRRLKNVMQNATFVAAQVWGRPLEGGGVAGVFFNRGETATDVTATFTELGLGTAVNTVTVVDVWSGKVTKGVKSPFTATAVEAHATAFVTFTPEL